MWSPATKLQVYKSHLRPVFEYAAPLALVLMDKHRCSQKLHKDLESFQTKCLQWVLGPRRPKAVLRSICGLGPLRTRFEELGSLFKLHLEAIPDNHPLKRWIASDDASSFLKELLAAESGTRSEIRSKFRANGMGVNSQTTMGSLIRDECRDRLGRDSCLFIKNPQLRNLAIRWRCNLIGVRSVCSECRLPFNRAHMETCVDVQLSASRERSFLIAKSECGPGSHYNRVDHLLNLKEYKLFDRALQSVRTILLHRLEQGVPAEQGGVPLE